MAKSSFLECEDRNGVRWIYFNRPEVRNAFSLDLAAELYEALKRAAADAAVNAVAISGRGLDFSAGGDIKMMGELLQKDGTEAIRDFFLEISKLINACVLEIRKMPKPVIAAIPGYVGGIAFGFCLSADFRVVSPKARFQAATIHLGLVANGSATHFLPKLIGAGRAADVLLTGKIITAEEAVCAGLAQRLFSEEDFETQVQAFAETLTALPQEGQGLVKQILNEGLDANLEKQMEKERQAIAHAATTPEYRERVRRFLQKR